ncbi:hypothetical protein GNZ12_03150 [Paraburkholderia sp. 1N]|uniref:Uncharacterized protein n=1 Tax=Paraburkholderia solitsugae TaxID=2675748 RepID=A0ABX2BHU2_9BURK|nr:hypothetical protein [Paraburkholderia solitsugae]NPT40326.1 hypothetical protein [Paraburkholderia solitsugae]
MALTTYGNPQGSFGENASFADVLDDAVEFVSEHEHDEVVSYLSAKPLSQYLPVGLKRVTTRLGPYTFRSFSLPTRPSTPRPFPSEDDVWGSAVTG